MAVGSQGRRAGEGAQASLGRERTGEREREREIVREWSE